MPKAAQLLDIKKIDFSVIPPCMICPLSKKIMRNPVILVHSEQAYERSEILRWLKTNDMDPVTGLKLKSKNIIENVNLRGVVRWWIKNRKALAHI